MASNDDRITTVLEIDDRGRMTLPDTIRRYLTINPDEGEKELVKVTVEKAEQSETNDE